MVRGLYTSGWSMLALNKKMDVLTNNLANVSTAGYKKDTVVLEGFPRLLAERLHDNTNGVARGVPVGELSFSNDVGEVYTYFNQGSLLKTDNNLDMSIKDEGRAFFTIAVPGRGQFYTRDGSFKLNANGQLVTAKGYYVLGENGIIQLSGSDFTVTRDGTIIQNGEVVDRLLITQFQNPESLRKNGENLFSATPGSVVEGFNGEVLQNYLEQSNAEAIREMVDMISLMRSYEANQRVINAIDDTLGKAVNEVGRV